jgi:hypothetical protein
MYVCIYVCISLRMYVCMYVCMYEYVDGWINSLSLRMHMYSHLALAFSKGAIQYLLAQQASETRSVHHYI